MTPLQHLHSQVDCPAYERQIPSTPHLHLPWSQFFLPVSSVSCATSNTHRRFLFSCDEAYCSTLLLLFANPWLYSSALRCHKTNLLCQRSFFLLPGYGPWHFHHLFFSTRRDPLQTHLG